MSTPHLWHVWPGRHWPLTAAEESTFVRALNPRRRKGLPEPDRDHITALLNALRCGLTVPELRAVAPGLDPLALAAAYAHLEDLRRSAAAAWAALCADPTRNSVSERAPLAARLMPAPVSRIDILPARALAAAVAQALTEQAAVAAQADHVEAQLSRLQRSAVGPGPGPGRDGVELGRLLYDPYVPGLWAHPAHLPRRVGELMPRRVADLLGEPH